MMNEFVTMKEARESINHLVQGVDPYSGEVLEDIEFLQDSRMIRCFAVMSDVLTRCIEGKNVSYSKTPFKIEEGAIKCITFSEGEIGVMKLLSAINAQIDTHNTKKLSAFAFNKKLIEEGVLSYSTEEGSKKAVVNTKSEKQGIKSIKAIFNNEEYDKVVYDDKGKAYVMEHMLKWFGQEQ